jgi:hypothetical protein
MKLMKYIFLVLFILCYMTIGIVTADSDLTDPSYASCREATIGTYCYEAFDNTDWSWRANANGWIEQTFPNPVTVSKIRVRPMVRNLAGWRDFDVYVGPSDSQLTYLTSFTNWGGDHYTYCSIYKPFDDPNNYYPSIWQEYPIPSPVSAKVWRLVPTDTCRGYAYDPNHCQPGSGERCELNEVYVSEMEFIGVISPADSDGDGVADATDNCPQISNPNQVDTDKDGIGDACETPHLIDSDGDGVDDEFDNCPYIANADQQDTDKDDIGDACEPVAAPEFPTSILPAAMIIGFLGAVLLIQRTREH